MSKALTVKFIANAKPGLARLELPDAACPGLYLIVNPTGAKSWAVRYRFAGKPKKLTLGPVLTERVAALPAGMAPDLGEGHTLAEARARAGESLALVQEGADPAQEGKFTRQKGESDTVNSILDDFLSRHVEKNNRPSTQRETKRFLTMYVRPAIGGKKVKRVTKADLNAAIDRVIEEGGPASANRVLAILKKFFGWCVERDILTSSPAETMRPPAQNVSRDRVLTDQEIGWLWKASGEFPYPFGALWRLLILTAQRREEVAGATQKEFSLNGGNPLWVIPRDRSKNGHENAVPLSPAAAGLVASLPTIAGSAFIFSTTGETSVSGYSRAKRRLDARMLEIAQEDAAARGDDPSSVTLAPWRLHDLRRTAASGLARLGAPIHVVEAILNHRSGTISGVAAIYNRHDYAAEKRAWLTRWAETVESIAAGGV
ncbi:integrase arm-type DNA-binding domain-containing protein [Rhizobium leguminosarum]|uniref:tyrosine-type recombinase/integrase n=1 Tax=Rhizobium leguminosarum TaxID=384 RepID=UPI001C982A9A|nr:site-specific integrase [Rhizobium leguminosarum]MBY5762554.1 integrase arm-type DNA-binding domain-containing protein [Rhizobium leguminosarum]